MASKKRVRLTQVINQQPFNLLPSPQCAHDVMVLLKYSADGTPASTKMVAHLTEMGTLYPNELLGAFQAMLRRQIRDN